MYFFLINLFFLSKRFGFGGARDSKLDGLVGYRRSRTERQRGSNVARDFSRWVHRDNKAFPAKISTMRIPVLFRKQKKQVPRKFNAAKLIIKWSISPIGLEKLWPTILGGLGPKFGLCKVGGNVQLVLEKKNTVFHPTIPSTPNQLT